MKIRIIWIWMALVSVGYFGCSDMNDLHDQYRQRGEAIYVGQVDSLKLFPGKNRVKITYRNYDPKVSKLTVYWDFRQGSASFDVPTDRLGEEIEEYIGQLDEKNYTFELVTSNRSGEYKSIPLYISGPVYGSRYTASLTDRKVVYATHFFPSSNERMEISWASAIEKMVGVEILYRNASDVETVMRVGNDETNAIIKDLKDDAVTYRTLYLPEEACIDTFYTNYASINFEMILELDKMDKSLFQRWNPPGIPYVALGQGWENIEALWNGITNVNPGYMTDNRMVGGVWQPVSLTFDMGQMAKIANMKIFPRITDSQWYAATHPRKISIWGSPTDNVNEDFATWIYLGEFNGYRPSGNTTHVPNAAATPQVDRDHCAAGELFEATDNLDVAVRYLRFHVTENWQLPGAHVALMEIDIFGFFVDNE